MPQCPHCQAPYEVGQRYCSTCGSFLLHPEQGDTFCPQCGVRVSPRQEFCHECDAPLKGAQVAPEALGPPPEGRGAHSGGRTCQSPPHRLPVLAHRLVGGRGDTHPHLADPAVHPGHVNAPGADSGSQSRSAGSRSSRSYSGSRPSRGDPGSQPTRHPGPGAGPPAEATLKEQLQKELSILREAQLHKDIVQFMSVYSLTYPGVDDKRANTLKSWESFDFTNLVFTVDKIQPIDPDNAIAWVTWYIDTKNRRTQELSSGSQTYQVRFAKELGKWRIRSLEEVEP